jgi:hypothetical protein
VDLYEVAQGSEQVVDVGLEGPGGLTGGLELYQERSTTGQQEEAVRKASAARGAELNAGHA